MTIDRKKLISMVLVSLIIGVSVLTVSNRIGFLGNLNAKLYDFLLESKYKAQGPLPGIDDVVLVTIDNDTLSEMPHCWPYPRSDFRTVIENLSKAGAKVIAFDFAFLGRSRADEAKEDEALKAILESEKNVILAVAIDSKGTLIFRAMPGLSDHVAVGIVNKFQEGDGATRKALLYLVNISDAKRAYLSWGMQILKRAENIDLATLKPGADVITFNNRAGKKWRIPVDRQTKSYLINYSAHSVDFNRLSFLRAYKGDFDPRSVKGKIVMVGSFSSVLGDISRTPIGWLPGITLNANAFLTLYSRHFLKELPKIASVVIILLGVILSAVAASIFDKKNALIFTGALILAFFALSYIFIALGFIWDYALFPILTLCPYLISSLRGARSATKQS